uniref:Uncharacterized protein n=1 Tax=Vespula pensylvanica TaxID=30213 RepID=A0A834PBU4_VESPE|nr:hypothetical protein H0235_003417 [Vespula pensylvanica]
MATLHYRTLDNCVYLVNSDVTVMIAVTESSVLSTRPTLDDLLLRPTFDESTKWTMTKYPIKIFYWLQQ